MRKLASALSESGEKLSRLVPNDSDLQLIQYRSLHFFGAPYIPPPLFEVNNKHFDLNDKAVKIVFDLNFDLNKDLIVIRHSKPTGIVIAKGINAPNKKARKSLSMPWKETRVYVLLAYEQLNKGLNHDQKIEIR